MRRGNKGNFKRQFVLDTDCGGRRYLTCGRHDLYFRLWPLFPLLGWRDVFGHFTQARPLVIVDSVERRAVFRPTQWKSRSLQHCHASGSSTPCGLMVPVQREASSLPTDAVEESVTPALPCQRFLHTVWRSCGAGFRVRRAGWRWTV